LRGSPKYTFAGRKCSDLSKPQTPGPGTYTGAIDHVKFGSTPKYGFGGSPKNTFRSSNSPGPGEYTPCDPTKSASQHSFGTSIRKGGVSEGGEPGPGSYTLSPRMGSEGPKFSAGVRRECSVKETPGPGAYTNIDPVATKGGSNPQYGFSKSARSNMRLSSAPGLGKSETSLGDLTNTTTGPVTYSGDVEAIKFQKTPQYGFSGTGRDIKPSSAPGPGQYSPLDPTKSATHRSFGTSPRRAGAQSHESPGPGAYSLSPRMGKDGPKFTVGGPRPAGNMMEHPGPGAYRPEDNGSMSRLLSPRRHGFGTATRKESTASTSPGPGSYQDKSTMAGPKNTFGRRLEAPMKQTVGPGQYNHFTQFG